MNIFEPIQSFFNSHIFVSIYYNAKVIFIVLDTMLIIGFLYVYKKALWFRPNIHPDHDPRPAILTKKIQPFRKEWQAIIKKTNFELPHSVQTAIINVDSLVDSILSNLGFEGESLNDKLDQLSPELKTLKEVKHAHHFRNQIAEHLSGDFSVSDGKNVLREYRVFLQEIGIL